MIRVHAIPSYNPNGEYNACSYLRVVDPLKALGEKGAIRVSFSPQWTDGTYADIYYLQRQCGSNFDSDTLFSFLNHCKKYKKKVIYEIDDDLLDLTGLTYAEKSVVMNLIRSADVVVTTTDRLRERLSGINPNVAVIPNMLSQKRIGTHTRKQQHGRTRIGYMGTFTHQSDLQMILLPLVRLLKEHEKDVEFQLLGAVSDMGLLSMLPNVKVIPIVGRDSYPEFWNWVQSDVDWDIGIAPLKMSAFTACKSDIKYLDYAAMGVCGVFSDHPAYSGTIKHMQSGLLAQNTLESWYENIERLILDQDLRQKLEENAKEELMGSRLLEDNLWRWKDVLTS